MGEMSSFGAHFLYAGILIRCADITGNTNSVETCIMLWKGGGACGDPAECGKNDARV